MTAKPKPPLESEIQKAILDYLKLRHIYHWRQNTEGRVIQRGGKFIRIPTAGIKGVADILGFHKGIFFALEVKRPGGKPSPEQLSFMAEVQHQGHVGAFCYCVEDAKRALGGA